MLWSGACAVSWSAFFRQNNNNNIYISDAPMNIEYVKRFYHYNN